MLPAAAADLHRSVNHDLSASLDALPSHKMRPIPRKSATHDIAALPISTFCGNCVKLGLT